MKSFYVGIGAIIEKNNKYLVLKRSPEKDFAPNNWEVVTGRLEIDEDPTAGIIREVKEEVNLEIEILMPVDTGFFYRGGKEFPMVFLLYWCKYIRGEIDLSWEHTEFKWLTLEEVIKSNNLEPFRRSFELIKELKRYLPNDFKF